MSDTALVFDILTKGGKEAAAEFLAVASAADKSNNKIAVASRKMSLAVSESTDKAAKAQKAALDAAEKLERGEISEAAAAEAATKAQRALERASIKTAEAELAAAKAAEKASQEYKQNARDAELASAAERLGALRASGAVKDHNALLGSLRKEFGDISKEGNGAFQEMESGWSQVANKLDSGPGLIIGIVAALGAIPFAAAAAESAIALGVGGALAGLGLKATYADKDVQRTLQGLVAHVKSTTKDISSPFKQTWAEIAQTGRDTFDALVPELSSDFEKLAPAVSGFVHDTGQALTGLAPAFHAATNASTKLLASLGNAMPAIIHNVSSSIEIMSNSVSKNADDLSKMLVNVTALLPVLSHLIDYTVRFGGAVNPLFETMAHGQEDLKNAQNALNWWTFGLVPAAKNTSKAKTSLDAFNSTAKLTTDDLKSVHTSLDIAALSGENMANAFDKLTGVLFADREGMYSYRSSLTALNQSLKENGKNHGFATQKGAENEHALTAFAQAAIKASESMKADGKSANEVSQFLDIARQKIIAAAEKMGYSEAHAKALAKSLLGVKAALAAIPPGKYINLESNATTETRRINAVKSALDRLHNKTITITTYYREVEAAHHAAQASRARKDGGPIGRFADGGMPSSGPVVGPGTSRSDSILARLSNGEFVVNAKAYSENSALVQAINSGKVTSSKHRKSFAGLGSVKPVTPAFGASAAGTSQSAPASIDVYVDGKKLFQVMQEHGRNYTLRNRKSPFATSVGT